MTDSLTELRSDCKNAALADPHFAADAQTAGKNGLRDQDFFSAEHLYEYFVTGGRFASRRFAGDAADDAAEYGFFRCGGVAHAGDGTNILHDAAIKAFDLSGSR